jgi:uncharacterized membrane protein YbhN (UPF0104 family)
MKAVYFFGTPANFYQTARRQLQQTFHSIVTAMRTINPTQIVFENNVTGATYAAVSKMYVTATRQLGKISIASSYLASHVCRKNSFYILGFIKIL